MKKLSFIKSNKGVAIEIVIFAALVIFSLCSLMITYTLKSKQLIKYNTDVFEVRLYIDQIGDDYLNYLNKKTNTFDENGYSYKINDKIITYSILVNQTSEKVNLKVFDVGKIVLNIDYNYDQINNKYYVIKWVYGE